VSDGTIRSSVLVCQALAAWVTVLGPRSSLVNTRYSLLATRSFAPRYSVDSLQTEIFLEKKLSIRLLRIFSDLSPKSLNLHGRQQRAEEGRGGQRAGEGRGQQRAEGSRGQRAQPRAQHSLGQRAQPRAQHSLGHSLGQKRKEPLGAAQSVRMCPG